MHTRAIVRSAGSEEPMSDIQFAVSISNVTTRMRRGLGLDDAYHKLGRGRVGRQQIVCLEEIPCGDVAHAESDGGNRFAPEKTQKIVVAAASEKRTAIILIGIKYLKNHPRVVIEAARDRGIDYHIAHAQVFQRHAQFFEIGGGRDVLELLDELHRFFLVGNERRELLFEVINFRATVKEPGNTAGVFLCDANGVIDGVEDSAVRYPYLEIVLI